MYIRNPTISYHTEILIFQESSAPGSFVPSTSGDITLNAGRKTVKLKVTSLCDRPIQVC